MRTQTPRTDEALEITAFENKNHPATDWVEASFARQLERELNEATELADKRLKALQFAIKQGAADTIRLNWLLRPDVRIIEKDESLGTWTASEILESRESIDAAMEQPEPEDCPNCGGIGELPGDPYTKQFPQCVECDGTGKEGGKG
jgi:hypothetical protein